MPTILVYALLLAAAVCVDAWGAEKTVTKSDHTFPEQWTTVKRNIIEDAKKRFGWTTDNLRITGVTLAPLDGICGYFDAVEFTKQ